MDLWLKPDFVEMLSVLSAAEAEFIVVGAHALGVHGFPRGTGDLDIWVRPTAENADRVYLALTRFGAPLEGLTLQDLATPGVVYQIGIQPLRIDILTQISGVEFENAWTDKVIVKERGMEIPFIGLADLIANKRAAGRGKDLSDLQNLERLKGSGDA